MRKADLMLSHVNIGIGIGVTIKELGKTRKEVDHFWQKPDGTLQKLLHVSLLKKLGWSPYI